MTNEEILAHYRERYPYISLGRAWGARVLPNVPPLRIADRYADGRPTSRNDSATMDRYSPASATGSPRTSATPSRSPNRTRPGTRRPRTGPEPDPSRRAENTCTGPRYRVRMSFDELMADRGRTETAAAYRRSIAPQGDAARCPTAGGGGGAGTRRGRAVAVRARVIRPVSRLPVGTLSATWATTPPRANAYTVS